MRATVLVVDDEAGVLGALSRILKRAGHEVATAESGRAALERLAKMPIDVVLLDLHLPDQDGLSVLAAMRAGDFRQPVLMMSGAGTVDAAVKAIQLGALDFIEKPFVTERVLVSVENGLRFGRMAARQAELEAEAPPASGLLGQSAAMQRLRALIDKCAPTEGRVLITGENGTGKELVARAIHQGSRRREQAFVKVNCAAIPAELIESELFGHEKGAFTGAIHTRRGRFELADGGTIFLDEIGEMTASMQAKVLRVLQEGELERVGASDVLKVDVRVLAATNRDLNAMVKAGTFREDLFFRLNVINVVTPALRDHPEDIPELVQTFLAAAAQRNNRPTPQISADAVRLLATHDFPGNVRELQNLIERLLILSDGPNIDVSDVRAIVSPVAAPVAVVGPLAGPYRPGVPFAVLLDEAQRQILRGALAEHGFKMANAARALGLERSHLYKKCHSLGIELE